MFGPIRKRRCKTTVAALLLFIAAKAAAQQNTVEWDFLLDPATARRGEVVTVRLSATPQSNWYIYSHTQKTGGPQATKFLLDLPPGVRLLGAIEAPSPSKKFDKGFEIEVEYYHEPVVFQQKIAVGDNAATGPLRIKGTVRFQACNDVSCLPPKDVPFNLALNVENGPAREAFRAASGALFNEPARSGFLVFLFLALAQGFFALATPCVYPMIPITISFFLKQGEREGRRPVLLATAYAVSIIVTFTSVGVLLTLIYGPAGANRLATSPVTNLILAFFFIALALSLFGLYEIQVPTAMQNYLAVRGRGGGYAGTIFMGMAFTLASLACTAPFVGALLGLAATGKWFWPLVGMLGFSFAFSLPFFVLALFPQWLARMPHSGGWLNAVKVVMGFLVLAISLKFLANSDMIWNWQIFTRSVLLASWAMIATFAGLYLLGAIRLPHDTLVERVGVLRMLLSLAFLTLGLYLAAGLFGRKIGGTLDAFLPAGLATPSGTAPSSGQGAALEWIEDEDYGKALQRAKGEGKPILIDFSGYTCTNCKWMERNILTRADMAPSLERFVRLRLHTDGGPGWRENQRLQVERFGTPALPLYVIISPSDRELVRLAGLTSSPERFRKFLDEGIARFEAGRK